MSASLPWMILSSESGRITSNTSSVPSVATLFWLPVLIAKMLRAREVSRSKAMASLRMTMLVSRCIRDTPIVRRATSGFALRNARNARKLFGAACKLWKHWVGNITGSASVVLYVSCCWIALVPGVAYSEHTGLRSTIRRPVFLFAGQ